MRPVNATLKKIPTSSLPQKKPLQKKNSSIHPPQNPLQGQTPEKKLSIKQQPNRTEQRSISKKTLLAATGIIIPFVVAYENYNSATPSDTIFPENHKNYTTIIAAITVAIFIGIGFYWKKCYDPKIRNVSKNSLPTQTHIQVHKKTLPQQQPIALTAKVVTPPTTPTKGSQKPSWLTESGKASWTGSPTKLNQVKILDQEEKLRLKSQKEEEERKNRTKDSPKKELRKQADSWTIKPGELLNEKLECVKKVEWLDQFKGVTNQSDIKRLVLVFRANIILFTDQEFEDLLVPNETFWCIISGIYLKEIADELTPKHLELLVSFINHNETAPDKTIKKPPTLKMIADDRVEKLNNVIKILNSTNLVDKYSEVNEEKIIAMNNLKEKFRAIANCGHPKLNEDILAKKATKLVGLQIGPIRKIATDAYKKREKDLNEEKTKQYQQKLASGEFKLSPPPSPSKWKKPSKPPPALEKILLKPWTQAGILELIAKLGSDRHNCLLELQSMSDETLKTFAKILFDSKENLQKNLFNYWALENEIAPRMVEGSKNAKSKRLAIVLKECREEHVKYFPDTFWFLTQDIDYKDTIFESLSLESWGELISTMRLDQVKEFQTLRDFISNLTRPDEASERREAWLKIIKIKEVFLARKIIVHYDLVKGIKDAISTKEDSFKPSDQKPSVPSALK